MTPAPEPATFDARVRQPGLQAIADLVGEARTNRRGRRRAVVAQRREDIPPSRFPSCWTKATPDLLVAYHRICAYTSLYIERATGEPTVDHFWPKSQRWDLVYEWSNYRLACQRVNRKKGVATDVLDPFEIQDGWFELELYFYQVRPASSLAPEIRTRVENTIERLDLNGDAIQGQRREYGQGYSDGLLSLGHLESRAPFVARELRRQGKLHLEDL